MIDFVQIEEAQDSKWGCSVLFQYMHADFASFHTLNLVKKTTMLGVSLRENEG